ncbi:uncharacterized protein ACWYII_010146 isoform 3-T5 [Salvelinus alpinus]
MDNELVKIVIERVLINANGQSSQYSWIKPSALKDQSSGVSQQPRPRASRCIPLRTAKRTGRQRGLPPGNTVAELCEKKCMLSNKLK